MTTKIKAIVSAAIAATLTAGISATALATKPVNAVPDPIAITDSNPKVASEVNETTVKKYDSLTEMLSPFELAIMMGEAPEHPDGRTYPIGRVIEVEDDVASTNSEIKLTRSTITNAYNYWVGNFTVSDLSGFAATFNEPDSFECSFTGGKLLTNGEKGIASMKAKSGYSGNYKSVRINYTFKEDNGEYTRYFVEKDGTGSTVSAKISDRYTGNGKLVEVACFYTLRSGTGSSATVRDYVYLHLVDNSYATTAAFAAEPYSGLIDTYTYLPEEMTE